MSGFRFTIEKVFPIPGRGVVVAGRVDEGTIATGQNVGFLKADGQWGSAVVIGVEVSGRLVEETIAGQQANLLLKGVKKGQIGPGIVLTEPPMAPAISVEPSPSQTDYPPEMRPPPIPSYGGPIRPSSSLWRMLIFALIGILILLALLFLQERAGSPGKGKRAYSNAAIADHMEV